LEQKKWKRIERILIAVLILLAFVVVGGIALFVYLDRGGEIKSTEEKTEKTGLADATTFLPDYCNLYEAMPDMVFYDKEGKEVKISDFKGKTLVITFWASWCPDCHEQMEIIDECAAMVEAEDDAIYILLNKLDHDKETKEKALTYLDENNIPLQTYFDDGLKVYDALGMHNVPTTFFIDKEGILRAWSGRQITDAAVFEAMLKNCIVGSETVTEAFVLSGLTDEKGGIHSSYDSASEQTTLDSDVLSESQGALLEYSLMREDKELFDNTLSYIRQYMWKNGMIAWRTQKDQPDKVNALIDDLRIYEALVNANKIWGGYQEEINNYHTNLKAYGIDEEHYIDFYDFQYMEPASRFTLCYGDLKVMSLLAKEDAVYQTAYDKAYAIVTEGIISNDFPLYYSWYNYDTEKYENTDLNMSEAMVTLLHLAEIGELPDKTVKWIKDELFGDGIRARYDVRGNVVTGYGYESTATYALVAMLGKEINDSEMTGKALNKMEKMRINNTTYSYNGAFGNEDGSGISSFDQLMPMLAYQYSIKKK